MIDVNVNVNYSLLEWSARLSGFEPKDPAYADRVRASFDHGGIIGTIADSAGGYAAFT